MKTVILAGGLGTRIAEETETRPKPMIEIGGKPILWHLLNIYAAAGFDEFVIALGYKQEVVRDYFRAHGEHDGAERWKVHLIDTGLSTMTGGRVKRLRELIGRETFMCTYGDGLAALDVADLLAFHRREGRIATLTAVRPPARFGALDIDGTRVTTFQEKHQASEGWINGGFFVFEPAVFDRIDGDATLLEHEPLAELARDGQLSCYKHRGFWQPMDTLRDKRLLEELWAAGGAPWASPPVRAAR